MNYSSFKLSFGFEGQSLIIRQDKWLTELGSNQCLTRYERIALPLSYQSINGGSRRN